MVTKNQVSPQNASSQLFSLGNYPCSDSPAANWRDCFPEIIGASESMEKLLKIVSKVAVAESPVLVCGESGTGKELIASALHRLSRRSGHKFVAINCSAIPESLLESELFGFVKGAFTGADSNKQGYFDAAKGGSIFLDEIGDMPGSLQAKLLRVLQEKQFSPVGSNEIKKADVRIIAATNVDLEKAVNEEKFRLDLFYRLNVLPINVPPLRERGRDSRLLLNHFLDIANHSTLSQNPCFFSDETLQILDNYNWPGNVRELQNLVQRLVVMSSGGSINSQELPKEIVNPTPSVRALSQKTTEQPLQNDDRPLPPPAGQSASEISIPNEGINLTIYIEEIENQLILQALERTGNNKNQAAKLLGLNRTTLVERIKKRKLSPLNSPSKEL